MFLCLAWFLMCCFCCRGIKEKNFMLHYEVGSCCIVSLNLLFFKQLDNGKFCLLSVMMHCSRYVLIHFFSK